MEKQNNNNKFMLKFSRIFSSSCITQDISKVIDHRKPIFSPKTPLMAELEPEPEEEEDNENNLCSYPVIRPHKQQTPLLACKPRCPESFDQMVRESCIIPAATAAGNLFPRRRRYSLLSPAGEFSGRRCPPVSPASPQFQRQREKKKKKKKQRSKNGGFGNKLDKTHFKNLNPFSFSSSNETDWFSSDDEREEEDEERLKTEHVLFPPSNKSISLSSDSETNTQNPVRNRRRRRNSGPGPSRVGRKREEMEGVPLQRKTEHTLFHPSNKSVSLSSKSNSLSSDSDPDSRNRFRNRWRRGNSGPGLSRISRKREEMVDGVPLQGKVKDTFAVVKSSSDPYSDFRISMVEMIMEKQIFGERELEQLLQCFLSLNSSHHHRVIVEVFTEIWDALFSYRS